MDFKAVPSEFKAASEEGRYSGYFSVFGNIDDGLDIIQPGAFTKTVQERARRIKVFHGHDWSKLVGPAPDVLQEDTRGLYVEGRLTLDSFWGRETWALLKDGAMTEGSIGFETVPGKVAWRDNGIREIGEVKLYEVSFVPLGMNPLTEVQAIKALRGTDPARYLETLEALLAEMKAGARHSKADTEALNQIHDHVVTLGCTNCGAGEDDPKTATPRAADALALRRRLRAAGLALSL